MKYGIRKPNIKKRIKARTTGKMKRQVKKAINPFYGKKGMGYIKNPKKAIKNSIYQKTTVGITYPTANNVSTSQNISQNNTVNEPLYTVLDNNTVKVRGKIWNLKKVKFYKNSSIILSILYIPLDFAFPLLIFLHLVCLLNAFYYYHMYKNVINFKQTD